MQRMRRGSYRYHNVCQGCNCSLDAGEGRYCEECLDINAKVEAYAKKWSMTVAEALELYREGMISA